jgi:glycosyltransferase involved in cell wall biosynthesis
MTSGLKTVLWLTDSPGFGGAEKTLIRVVDMLRDRVHSIVVHSASVCSELREWAADCGVETAIMTTGNRIEKLPVVAISILKLAQRYPEALFAIWAHHSDSSRWQQVILMVLRRQYLVSERLIPDCREAFATSRLSIPIKRWTSGSAEAVVLNAHSQVEPFRKIFGIAGRNLRVIANSRPVRAIAESVGTLREDRAGLRRGLNLDEKPVLLCLGRLAGQKDQSSLLKACESVATPFTVLLVGEGPERAELESLSRKLTGHRVVFAGHQSDPLPWLAAADLFVLPSLTEGLPGALIEAMAAGLPCITTDIPGNRELVIDGLTGLAVPVKAPELLAKAINRLLDNPALAQRLATAGFEHVAAHYDEAAEKAAWQGLAAELVGEKCTRARSTW